MEKNPQYRCRIRYVVVGVNNHGKLFGYAVERMTIRNVYCTYLLHHWLADINVCRCHRHRCRRKNKQTQKCHKEATRIHVQLYFVFKTKTLLRIMLFRYSKQNRWQWVIMILLYKMGVFVGWTDRTCGDVMMLTTTCH